MNTGTMVGIGIAVVVGAYLLRGSGASVAPAVPAGAPGMAITGGAYNATQRDSMVAQFVSHGVPRAQAEAMVASMSAGRAAARSVGNYYVG